MNTHTLRKHKSNDNQRILTFNKRTFERLKEADMFAVSLCIDKLLGDLKQHHGILAHVDHQQLVILNDRLAEDEARNPAFEGQLFHIKKLFIAGVMDQPSIDFIAMLETAEIFVSMLRDAQAKQ